VSTASEPELVKKKWLMSPGNSSANGPHDLGQRALEAGVVIESVNPCYTNPAEGNHRFRIGASTIAAKKIATGIKLLREAYERLMNGRIKARKRVVRAPAQSSCTPS
jgi:hypothetical protein